MEKVVFLILTVLLLGCVTKDSKNQVVLEGEMVNDTVYSSSIERALLEENPNQSVNVYLPPGYSTSGESYPVIYFLHGFGEKNQYSSIQKSVIDKAINSGTKPFIIVEPNGTSSLGGSFYYNSEVTGYWEDYIVNDVIEYIDSNYRTKAEKESRGIAGFSMGGTGAINIALKHPDKFNALYAFCPGLLKDGDLDELLESWGGMDLYYNSYAAVASPNRELDPPWEIPYRTHDNNEINSGVLTRWYSVFGDYDKKVDTYLESDHRLKGIKININKMDFFKWIIRGGNDFHEVLNEKGVEHIYDYGDGPHRLPSLFYSKNVIPFFTEYLE